MYFENFINIVIFHDFHNFQLSIESTKKTTIITIVVHRSRIRSDIFTSTNRSIGIWIFEN